MNEMETTVKSLLIVMKPTFVKIEGGHAMRGRNFKKCNMTPYN